MQQLTAMILALLLFVPACNKAPEQPKSPEGAEGSEAGTPSSDPNAQGAGEGERRSTPAKGAVQSPSGLRYEILKEGTGAKPKLGATVLAHVKGWLPGGKIFMDTTEGGAPQKYRVDKMSLIDGWVETLLDMKAGEKRRIQVPSNLAYGRQGYAGVVPPNTSLEFEIELVGSAK